MNTDLALPLLVTTIVAIVGWLVVHRMEMNRDRQNKRRDLIVRYLIDAYRRIESCTNRKDGLNSEQCRLLESSMADIQLLGTARQSRLAREFIKRVAEHQAAQADSLLEDLRSGLRNELVLGTTPEDISYLRFNRDDTKG